MRMAQAVHALAAAGLLVLLAVPVYGQGQVGGNLLQNPDFEGPYRQYAGFRTAIVAEGWRPWWMPQPAGAPAWQSRMPEYKAAAPYEYRIHSENNAQQLFSFYGTHTGGVYQVVGGPNSPRGIEPGSRVRFTIWGHAWAGGDDDPYESVGGGPMHMAIGVDPTGGTSARSARIVWSEEKNPLDEWVRFAVEAVAIGRSVTVFTRSAPEYPTKHNDVYWDTASLVVIAPPPTLTVAPQERARQVVAYRSSAATPTATLAPQVTPTKETGSTPASTSPTPTSTFAPSLASTPTPTPTPTPATSAICVVAYRDGNGNDVYDERDVPVAGSVFTVLVPDRGQPIRSYVTNGMDEPFCMEGLESGLYLVTQRSPPGYRSVVAEWGVRLAANPVLVQAELQEQRTSMHRIPLVPVATVEVAPGGKRGRFRWGIVALPVSMVVVLAIFARRRG
jgi:hypothetical protein